MEGGVRVVEEGGEGGGGGGVRVVEGGGEGGSCGGEGITQH